MPSAIAHAAPVLALIPFFAGHGTPLRLFGLGVACAIAPDLDVVTFRLGIPYEHPLGHRGFWHSFAFAALLAAAVTRVAFPRERPDFSRVRAWLFLFLATASHGVLDAFTNGGLGVALFSPIDLSRYFFPFRPIEVSPLRVGAFFSARGLAILRSELVWVWLPCAAVAATAFGLRNAFSKRGAA